MKKILKDIDGNSYKTTKIGKQIWTSENFRCTHFNNGKKIPLVKDNEEWSKLKTPGCCFYDNDSTADSGKYGALYNWYAVNTGKLAPKGWHVPTDAEWAELEKNFNKDKFSGFLGGYRFCSGTFYYLSHYGSWWSATEFGASSAYYRDLYYFSEDLYRHYDYKRCGFAVCLVRD